MYLIEIPYNEYENVVYPITDYNINEFITGSNIVIPMLREEFINLSESLDNEFTDLLENDITIAVTESQIIEPQITE